MAVSSSNDYSLDRDTIIKKALQKIGVVGEGGTPNANQLSDCAVDLNVLAKDWVADGLHLWKNEPIVIFPVTSQRKYTLKSGGDRACLLSDYVKTELNGDHASGASSLTVDSTTGMADSDVVGIELDDGTIQWTTASDATSSSTSITLAASLTGAASDNNNVYTYTNVIAEKPVRVIDAFLREDSGGTITDTPVDVMAQKDFYELSDKTSTGEIVQIWAEPKLTSLEINVWQPPGSTESDKVLVCICQIMIYDFDSATDDMDFPIEWGRALIYNLAADLGENYGVDPIKMARLEGKARTLKERIDDYDVELGSIFLQPDHG